MRLASISRANGSRRRLHSRSVGSSATSSGCSALPANARSSSASSQSSAARRSPSIESPSSSVRRAKPYIASRWRALAPGQQTAGDGEVLAACTLHHRARRSRVRDRAIARLVSDEHHPCRSLPHAGGRLRLAGCEPEAAPERDHREQQPVEVVVDVVVGREAGAGVLRLVPAAVLALGLDEPAHTPLERLRALAGGVQREQRPGGLRGRAVAAPDPALLVV